MSKSSGPREPFVSMSLDGSHTRLSDQKNVQMPTAMCSDATRVWERREAKMVSRNLVRTSCRSKTVG